MAFTNTLRLKPALYRALGCCVLIACGSSPSSDQANHSPGSGSTASSGGSNGSSGSNASSGSNGSNGSSGSNASNGSGSSTGSADGGSGFTTPDGGFGSSGDGGACSSSLASRIRITEIDVGTSYDYNEVDNMGAALGLTPLAISAIPGGGSRLAFLGAGDGNVHIVTLDANDAIVAGSAFTRPAYDFQDIYADATGGTILVSRTAMGGTAADNNCGNVNNLCGAPGTLPTTATCEDMYLLRFDGTNETWAAKLTDTTPTLPAYGLGPTTGNSFEFIWSEYAHNGRIAFDGTNYGAYFGVAITAPNEMCVDATSTLKTAVNIHQGDRFKIVNGAGTVQPNAQNGGFDVGCSHSGYERVIWDATNKRYVEVCKNDAPDTSPDGGMFGGRIAIPPAFSNNDEIMPVDLDYSDLGSVLVAGGGTGYWAITSNIRAGQPLAPSNGLADIDLVQFNISGNAVTTPNVPIKSIAAVSDTENDRAPHLAAYSSGLMVMAWEESTAVGDLAQNDSKRKMYVQILDQTTGGPPAGSTTTSAGPLNVAVLGSRYQDFRSYPDGSVAYLAPVANSTKMQVLRILNCD